MHLGKAPKLFKQTEPLLSEAAHRAGSDRADEPCP